jgi:Ca-activated chloride channel family protein
MRKLAGIVAAAALLGAGVLAQEQARVFRGGVQTVPIYATVLDSTGRLVPDLKEQDFEVFDNGKPTPITLFDREVQPIAVVVALDMSGSMINAISRVKDAAEAFLLRLLPSDRAVVSSFDDKIIMSPGFISDRDELIRFLRTGLQYGNGTRLWDAVYQSVALLQNESERKVVLVLSDGEDSASSIGKNDVLSRAQDNHVMVYAVGMRNRYRGGPYGEFVISRPDSFLSKLTSETGGGNFEATEAADLNTTFTRVAEELHRQYLIGIAPTQLDGKLHKLEVRVKVPGMSVRARKSYQATKESDPVPAPAR